MTKTCQNDNGICIFLKPCHIEGDDHDYFHGHDHNKYNDNEHYHDLNYNKTKIKLKFKLKPKHKEIQLIRVFKPYSADFRIFFWL